MSPFVNSFEVAEDMPVSVGVAYAVNSNESNLVTDDKHNVLDENVNNLLERGIAKTVSVGLRGTQDGKGQKVAVRIQQTGSFDDFVGVVAGLSGYGPDDKGIVSYASVSSPVGKMVNDPACSYVFETLNAITCKDSQNQALQLAQSWYDQNLDHNSFQKFADTIQGRTSYVDSKNVTKGYKSRNVNNLQMTGMEYIMACTLADKELGKGLSNKLAMCCTKVLANNYGFDKEPAKDFPKFLSQVEHNAEELLKASSGLSYDEQRALVASYVNNLAKSRQLKVASLAQACRDSKVPGLENPNVFTSPGEFVKKRLEKGIADEFKQNDMEAARSLFAAMGDGTCPGFSPSGGVNVKLPSIYLSSLTGEKSSVPRSDMFLPLMMSVRERMGPNFGNKSSFGFLNSSEVTRNLRNLNEEIDGATRPFDSISYYHVVNRKNSQGKGEKVLCKTDFVSIDSVTSESFRGRLESMQAWQEKQNADVNKVLNQRRQEKQVFGITANRNDNLASYLGKLKAASNLNVPFIADAETVARMKVEANRMAFDIGRGDYMEFKDGRLSEFWKNVDNVSAVETKRFIAELQHPEKQQVRQMQQPQHDTGMDR